MFRVVVSVALSSLTCCSSCRSEVATNEPGDSGAADVRDDASRDVGETGAVEPADTATGDAPLEVGADDNAPPFFGTWASLSGAPVECGAVLSLEPAVAAPPLKWVACASGRPGCRQLEITWPWSTRLGPPFRLSYNPVFKAPTGTQFVHIRCLGRTPDDVKDRFLTVLGPLDGAPSLVLRMDYSRPTRCSFAGRIGSHGFATLALRSPEVARFVVDVPWGASAPKVTTLDLKDLGPPTPAGVQRMAVSVEDFFLEAYSPNGIGVFHFPTGTVSPRKAPVEGVVGVLDGAIGINFSTRSLALVRPDSTWIDLAVPGTSLTVTEVAVDHASSDTFVWAESKTDPATGEYTSPTIWTSPYAKEPSAIKRRKVAALTDTLGSGAAGMIANAGMVLTQTNKNTATLTRLSDGVGWSIAAEPGQSVAGPIWVDDDEVIVGVKPAGSPGSANSIQRLKRDSLGPPTIPSGL